MAGKHAIPIFLALVLSGGVATGTAAAAVARTGLTAPAVAGAQPGQPPTAPTNLTLSQIGPFLIRLSWDPSTDGSQYPPHHRVAAYDIYASTSPFRLIASVPGNVLTFIDLRSRCVTVSYYVKARNAAGEVSPPSNTVTRPGKKCGRREADEAEAAIADDRSHHDTEQSHHDTEQDKEIIKADKLLHVEHADDDGGSGGHWSDDSAHGGGPGHEGAPVHAAGAEKPAAQQPGKHLPFTGAPVAAVAGVGGALLVAGAAGVLISVRRRRSAGAR